MENNILLENARKMINERIIEVRAKYGEEEFHRRAVGIFIAGAASLLVNQDLMYVIDECDLSSAAASSADPPKL
jgi:hypothetical protein